MSRERGCRQRMRGSHPAYPHKVGTNALDAVCTSSPSSRRTVTDCSRPAEYWVECRRQQVGHLFPRSWLPWVSHPRKLLAQTASLSRKQMVRPFGIHKPEACGGDSSLCDRLLRVLHRNCQYLAPLRNGPVGQVTASQT